MKKYVLDAYVECSGVMQNVGHKKTFYEEIRHFQFASVNLFIIFDEDLSPTIFITEHRTPQIVHKLEQNTLFSLRK